MKYAFVMSLDKTDRIKGRVVILLIEKASICYVYWQLGTFTKAIVIGTQIIHRSCHSMNGGIEKIRNILF